MQNACTANKVTKVSLSSGDKFHKYTRDPPIDEKGPPRITLMHGPANSTFSQGQMVCPPLLLQPLERQLKKCSPSPRARNTPPCSRGKPSGIQRKVVGYDDVCLGIKRKGSNMSSTISSSLSGEAKCKRLSPLSAPAFSPVRERLSGICSLRAWRKDPTSK